MINITFGYHYDSQQITDKRATSGDIEVGPLGLVLLLETQLGLNSYESSFTTRLVQYHQCLKQTLSADRFYYQSFVENEFASSRTLLKWRDELYLGGWSGSFPSNVPIRLQDLADVEQAAKETVDPNLGQRLQRIITHLQTNKVQIAGIVIEDKQALLPPIFLRVFEALAQHCKVVEDLTSLTPNATHESDLSTMQQALISEPSASKVALQGDGSFLLLTAASKSVSASHIAHLVTHQHGNDSSLTYAILAEHEREYLDTGFEQLGAARSGRAENSPWRPAFQVLPLCFEILWAPLNPIALLEFFSLPIGPIPSRIRNKLADFVAETPGMGSDAWFEMIASELRIISQHDKKLAERCQSAIDDWLPAEFICPKRGIDVEFAITHTQKLIAWLQGFNIQFEGKPESELYNAALNQATELSHALITLKSSGSGLIDRENLRHLIMEVRGTGIPLVDKYAEAHPDLPVIQVTSSAGAFRKHQDCVIWWACEAYQAPKKAHWSKKELHSLAQHSVNLWPTKHQLRLEATHWLRPILAAKQQLVIVLHPKLAQHHPVIDNIAGLCTGWREIQCEQAIINNERHPFCGSATDTAKLTKEVEHKALPSPSRWWKLGDAIDLPKREQESFSSLDKFINSPYQWVLNYQAKLRASRALEISDGKRLKGNIAHKVFEAYFTAHEQLHSDRTAIKNWADQNIDHFLETEGAVLLMPGRRSEAMQLKEKLTLALQELVRHLKSANIQSVRMEESQDCLFTGGKLTGYIDLLAVTADDQEVVIDIKWGGYNYRKKSMETDQYLQLAVYAAMRKEITGKWPALAYFIVENAKLICNTEHFFTAAKYVPAESGENVAELWQRFIETWKWRRDQIHRGMIEVTTSNTESDPASNPPETGLPIPESSDTYNDFAVLTGWGE